jgi:hypothetical protein
VAVKSSAMIAIQMIIHGIKKIPQLELPRQELLTPQSAYKEIRMRKVWRAK